MAAPKIAAIRPLLDYFDNGQVVYQAGVEYPADNPVMVRMLARGEAEAVKGPTKADREAAARAEAERVAAEREADRLAAEQAEADRLAAEQAEVARLAAERSTAQTSAQRVTLINDGTSQQGTASSTGGEQLLTVQDAAGPAADQGA